MMYAEAIETMGGSFRPFGKNHLLEDEGERKVYRERERTYWWCGGLQMDLKYVLTTLVVVLFFFF